MPSRSAQLSWTPSHAERPSSQRFRQENAAAASALGPALAPHCCWQDPLLLHQLLLPLLRPPDVVPPIVLPLLLGLSWLLDPPHVAPLLLLLHFASPLLPLLLLHL